jgi:hypothetical protein
LERAGVAPGLEDDERMSALETEAKRLEAIGATRAYRVEPDKSMMESGFITMHDPEDNEFCLDPIGTISPSAMAKDHADPSRSAGTRWGAFPDIPTSAWVYVSR